MGWVTDDDVAAMNDHDSVLLRINDRLERMAEREDRKRITQGWTRDGEDWVPPGWVKA